MSDSELLSILEEAEPRLWRRRMFWRNVVALFRHTPLRRWLWRYEWEALRDWDAVSERLYGLKLKEGEG